VLAIEDLSLIKVAFSVHGLSMFLTTLEERMDIITNYFISSSSSGWVEGLNPNFAQISCEVSF
jgi:hypothetical protein